MSRRNHPRKGLAYIDHFAFQKEMWPQYSLYDKQREIARSVERDDETYITAGNKLGKDFTAGEICVNIFLRCLKLNIGCRIVTHSVAEHHLKVLWAEIARFVTTCKRPLIYDSKENPHGPLIMNYMEIRRASEADARNPQNYLIGRVSEKGEGLAGHHAEWTLFVSDEASGGDDVAYKMAQGWAKHMLIFGNPNACTNYFYRGVKGGDIRADDGTKYHRRVFRLTAEDSPNVRYARAEIAAGLKPTNTEIVPNVLTWSEYQTRRKTWDKERQCIGLDAKFYDGAQIKLYPRDWLDRAEKMAELLELKGMGRSKRKGKAMGVDPAEGGDRTALVVVDELGIVDWEYAKTPDTSTIGASIIYMMQKHGIDPYRVCIDREGGGKQIADHLRSLGHDIHIVGFGESVLLPPQRGMVQVEDRLENRDERYLYKNRRAQMYHALRILLDPFDGAATDALPDENEYVFESDAVVERPKHVSTRQTFAIPREFRDLRDELEPLPFTRILGGQGEGLIYLIPKDRPNATYKGPTMKELIGHSPDLADATVLAIYGLQREEEFIVGAF